MNKVIYADHDKEGVYVYQAFKPKIVAVAVELNKFGKGFGVDRISWIKPSLGWMLRRSKYATKHRMEAIARIKLSHESWLEILNQSIPTHFDAKRYSNENEWQSALKKSDVIHQWDPERSLQGERLNRQAIQIGLRGDVLKKYKDEYVIGVEDITDLAKSIGFSAKKRQPFPANIPEEKEYLINENLKFTLGY
ncbi:MAG: DUF4291 family protein [Saprospiraceae bacterium]